LYVFSKFDLSALRKMPDAPEAQVACAEFLAWYATLDRVDPSVRRRIGAYLEQSDASFPGELNFDQVRPRLNNYQNEQQYPQTEVQGPPGSGELGLHDRNVDF
jgi:hypothetical protein